MNENKSKVLVSLDFIKSIVSSVSIEGIAEEAQNVLDDHNRNLKINAFYVKWQLLEKLNEKDLETIVGLIDRLLGE